MQQEDIGARTKRLVEMLHFEAEVWSILLCRSGSCQ
jgi:hypothetical protein